MKINAVWHKANRMPKNPDLGQRLKWHKQHSENCQCRPLTPKVIEEIKKYQEGGEKL